MFFAKRHVSSSSGSGSVPAPSRTKSFSQSSSRSSSQSSSSPSSQSPESKSSSQSSSSQSPKTRSLESRERLPTCLRKLFPRKKKSSASAVFEKSCEPCEDAPTNTGMHPPLLVRLRKRFSSTGKTLTVSRPSSISSPSCLNDNDDSNWMIVPHSVIKECKIAKPEISIHHDTDIAKSLNHTSDFLEPSDSPRITESSTLLDGHDSSTLFLHEAPSVSSSIGIARGCYIQSDKQLPSTPPYEKPPSPISPYDEQSIYEPQLLLGLGSLHISDKKPQELEEAARICSLLGTPSPSIVSDVEEHLSSLNTAPKQVDSDSVDVADCSFRTIEAAGLLLLLGSGRSVSLKCPQPVESSLDDAGDRSLQYFRDVDNNSSQQDIEFNDDRLLEEDSVILSGDEDDTALSLHHASVSNEGSLVSVEDSFVSVEGSSEETVSERSFSVPPDEHIHQDALLLLGLSALRHSDDKQEEHEQQPIQHPISYSRSVI